MIFLQTLMLIFVAAVGTAVVVTRDVAKQAVVMGFYGLLLSILFLLLQAPDVAYSEIVVGSAAIPLMLLVTVSKIRRSR